MRYGTPIYFQRNNPGAYDPESGDYLQAAVEEVQRYAAVTSTDEATMRLVYGAIRQGSLKIQLQNHYTAPFDTIRVGDKVYAVDYKRNHRVKSSFVVSEVQHGH